MSREANSSYGMFIFVRKRAMKKNGTSEYHKSHYI